MPFTSQWVDGLTEWMPGEAYASGTYQWTVQPWSPTGFGLKSAPAQFVVVVPTTGAATPPTAIGPAGTLPGPSGVEIGSLGHMEWNIPTISFPTIE